jgi:trimethylamine-N-oxide reductase (cytochrome c)
MPAQYTDKIFHGLGTPSSKFEFVPKSLQMIEDIDPDRPALNRYIPSREGRQTSLHERFPLQLLTSHPFLSFHTQNDGKSSAINTLKDHRLIVNGRAYWILRMHPHDAAKRDLAQSDLIKVYNDRGAVICAVDIAPTLMSGTVKAYTSSAELDLVTTPEGVVDRGGCMNLLTSTRQISKTSDGIAPNNCLVEVKKWDGVIVEEAA